MDRTRGTFWERTADALVGLVSPRRATLRRLWRAVDCDPEARSLLDAVMRQRGYATAESAHGGPQWSDVSASADADLSADLAKLRNRSRQANRDDAIASGLSLTRELNVVGPELKPQARTGDKVKDDALELVWRDRKNRLDPINRLSAGAGQRLRLRKLDEDGEVFVSRAIDETGALYFELIEADRVAIDYPMGSVAAVSAGATVVDGVERDATGRPVAYHVWDYAPGAMQRGPLHGNTRRRLTTQQCRHVKRTQRPGQTRGVPANHAVLRDLRDLDLLLVASLKRAQIAACLAAFITSGDGASDFFDVTAERYGYRLDQSIEPGMIWKLYPGETVTPFVPSFPFPELEPLVIMVARRIGAARGCSWQTVLNDWSQSNYSSARTQLLEDRQGYVVDRQTLCDELLTWEWIQVMEWELLLGNPALVEAGVTPEDVRRVEWIAFGWAWVDPLKEGQAVELALRIGLTTLRDEAAAVGKDWQELVKQRLEEEKFEAKLREEMGLPPRAAGQAPAAPEADDKPEADERPKRINGAGRLARAA